mmetsp:Transcript_36684/g.86006  ORF Transcript_36684/g.86006 Transcript_36684/m.86006 type:complete len:226 (-) Transcript_36684:144-821(-)
MWSRRNFGAFPSSPTGGSSGSGSSSPGLPIPSCMYAFCLKDPAVSFDSVPSASPSRWRFTIFSMPYSMASTTTDPVPPSSSAGLPAIEPRFTNVSGIDSTDCWDFLPPARGCDLVTSCALVLACSLAARPRAAGSKLSIELDCCSLPSCALDTPVLLPVAPFFFPSPKLLEGMGLIALPMDECWADPIWGPEPHKGTSPFAGMSPGVLESIMLMTATSFMSAVAK